MTSQTLVSLALLKASWDQDPNDRNDFLDFFVPMIGEVIFQTAEPIISVSRIQEKLEVNSGIKIPQNVINIIFIRLYQKGYLLNENGTYQADLNKLQKFDFSRKRADYLRKYTALIENLVTFCRENYKITMSPEEANEALLAFLEEKHHMVIVLQSIMKGTVIPISARVEVSRVYLIAKYIEHIERNSPSYFEYLEETVKGLMIANAVFLPNVEHSVKEFSNTQVFIDTPILIYFLGYAGETLQKPSKELLELLRSAKAELCCFDHSVAEARRIFMALANRLEYNPSSAFGPSVEYFLSRKATSSDIIEISTGFEKDLLSAGIKIVPKPKANADDFMIDEAKLENDLKPYNSQRALTHDVVSVSSIYRLREGQEKFSLEECVALFATNNTRLARRVRQHFAKEFNTDSIALVMDDQTLTNIVWLKNPTAIPSVARNRIMADCYVTIQPSEDLWKLFLEKFEELKEKGEVDPDRYFALRYATVTKSALMDVTLGDEHVFTEGTTSEIIELATQRIRQNDLNDKENLASENKSLNDKLNKENERKENRAKLYAKNRIKVIKMLGFTIFTIVTFLSLPLNYTPLKVEEPVNNLGKWIIFIGVVAVWLVGLLEELFKIKLSKYSIKYVMQKIESRLYKAHYDYLSK